jgi:aspartyl/asparaginyl-tRNA synthetase
MSEPSSSVPPAAPAGAGAPEEPSKNALKKAAKDAEKAKKKAEKEAKRQAELAQRQKDEAASDFAAENYGEKPSLTDLGHHEWVNFTDAEKYAEKDEECWFRCVVANSRVQSAKLGFLTLEQGLESIQMVIAENKDAGVSRQMVKFSTDGIPVESVLSVAAKVKKTTEKIKSATVQDYELHACKVYILAKSHAPLPLQPAHSEGALPKEEEAGTEGAEKEKIDESGTPLVSLNTRLNNRTLDLRAKINHCIFQVKDGVDSLFQEFLRSKGFMKLHTPKIIGAPSEGNHSPSY